MKLLIRAKGELPTPVAFLVLLNRLPGLGRLPALFSYLSQAPSYIGLQPEGGSCRCS